MQTIRIQFTFAVAGYRPIEYRPCGTAFRIQSPVVIFGYRLSGYSLQIQFLDADPPDTVSNLHYPDTDRQDKIFSYSI
jgi:hypothetical protein